MAFVFSIDYTAGSASSSAGYIVSSSLPIPISASLSVSNSLGFSKIIYELNLGIFSVISDRLLVVRFCLVADFKGEAPLELTLLFVKFNNSRYFIGLILTLDILWAEFERDILGSRSI